MFIMEAVADSILCEAGEQPELFDGQFPVGFHIVVADQQIGGEAVCLDLETVGNQERMLVQEEGVDAIVHDSVSDFVSQHDPADLFREVGVDVDDLDAVAQLVEAAHSTRQRYE